MSSTANAHVASLGTDAKTDTTIHQTNDVDSSHNLQGRTADEGNHNITMALNDDADTTAASEELKHTTISDKVMPSTQREQPLVEVEATGEDKDMKEMVKESTPEADPTSLQYEDMRERISSPKKKRGRDLDEDIKDPDDSPTSVSGSAADGSALNGSRTERSGPEKKRPRDTSEDHTKAGGEKEIKVCLTSHIGASRMLFSMVLIFMQVTTPADSRDLSSTLPKDAEKAQISSDAPKKGVFGSDSSGISQTSPTAFASSGFASLATTSTSGFGSLGAAKPSVFGGGKPLSGFGALTSKPAVPADKPAPALSFGGSPTSGFGGLGTGSVFGSRLGNGFSAGSGTKLSSFAAPGKENDVVVDSKPAKPVKAFGAPEASEEEESDEQDSDVAEGSGNEEARHVSIEKEKKASKIARGMFPFLKDHATSLTEFTVHIEDGESGEATLLQIRAKLFALESKEVGWKERGVGTLKINVPSSCASFDDQGLAIPGSFDASGLEEEDDVDTGTSKVARLIMRQENTHRVVLNTIIIKAMKFEDKPATSTAQIIFTAFEGEQAAKPINMLLKVRYTPLNIASKLMMSLALGSQR